MGVKGELSNNCAGWGLAFIVLHGKLSRLCAAHQNSAGRYCSGEGELCKGGATAAALTAGRGGARDGGCEGRWMGLSQGLAEP